MWLFSKKVGECFLRSASDIPLLFASLSTLFVLALAILSPSSATLVASQSGSLELEG